MQNKLFIIAMALCLFCGCGKDPEPAINPETPDSPGTVKDRAKYFQNYFGFSIMDGFYLWKYEVKEDIDNWQDTDDPINKVFSLRYKDPVTHTEVDHWTELMDDYESFNNQITGNSSSTYGYDFFLMYYDSSMSRVVAVVTYVYAGSPAENAGLKRGDVILKVNGKIIPSDERTMTKIITESMLQSQTCTLSLNRKKDVSMIAVPMYEDPVLLYKTFDCKGKKVGYLHYTSFTDASCERLVEACKYFKSEGVKELILDLRYNGGGYVNTEELLISMLAPEKAVQAKELFSKEIYNKDLAELEGWGAEVSTFTTDFEYVGTDNKVHKISTADANIGINKLYALVSNMTASASEALITFLLPFNEIDVEIIGEQTSGKYCAGIIYPGLTWFDAVRDDLKGAEDSDRQYLDNWAIYVMISRYSDRNGNTPCMPNGLTPNIKCEDDPMDGYQLGDPMETMLAMALDRAGYKTNNKSVPASCQAENEFGTTLPDKFHNPLPFVKNRAGQLPAPFNIKNK